MSIERYLTFLKLQQEYLLGILWLLEFLLTYSKRFLIIVAFIVREIFRPWLLREVPTVPFANVILVL